MLKNDERKHIDQIIFNIVSLANINNEVDVEELNRMAQEIYEYIDKLEVSLDKIECKLEELKDISGFEGTLEQLDKLSIRSDKG